jgi:hypothetical protein
MSAGARPDTAPTLIPEPRSACLTRRIKEKTKLRQVNFNLPGTVGMDTFEAVCECGAPATFFCADECGSLCADCSAKVHRIARNRSHSVQPIATAVQAQPIITSPTDYFGRNALVTATSVSIPMDANDRSTPSSSAVSTPVEAAEFKSDEVPTAPATNGAPEPVVPVFRVLNSSVPRW